MLSKQEFAETTCEIIFAKYGKSFVVQDVMKNNGVSMTGLSLDRSEINGNIVPTIYIDSEYNSYLELGDAFDFDGFCEAVYNSHMNSLDNLPKLDVNKFQDFSVVKDKVYAVFRGVKSQSDYFFDKPFKKIDDDLICTYRCLVDNTGTGKASFTIDDNMLKAWGISKNELHELAVENTIKLDPPTFKKLSEVIAEMMGVPVDQIDDMEMAPEIYYISNTSNIDGAGVLVSDEVRMMITEKIGDCYILPSSIHECLCVPKSTDMELDYIKELVKMVNGDSSVIDKKDVLTDNVFELSGKTLKLAKENVISKNKNMNI